MYEINNGITMAISDRTFVLGSCPEPSNMPRIKIQGFVTSDLEDQTFYFVISLEITEIASKWVFYFGVYVRHCFLLY